MITIIMVEGKTGGVTAVKKTGQLFLRRCGASCTGQNQNGSLTANSITSHFDDLN